MSPKSAEPAAPIAEQPNTCSKCSKELDTTGYPKWCRSCRAANKREYERTKKDMQETRGYTSGISAMREYLASEFARRYGSASHFNGYDVAHIIRTCEGPKDE